MRPVMVNETYTNLSMAVRKDGEDQIKKMADKLMMPEVFPKPNCGGVKFIRHEDGWQCLNCYKIIYTHRPTERRTSRRASQHRLF